MVVDWTEGAEERLLRKERAEGVNKNETLTVRI
jgi:hypothetical protein